MKYENKVSLKGVMWCKIPKIGSSSWANNFLDLRKNSHPLKKIEFCENNHKTVTPPPHPRFMKSSLFLQQKCANIMIFATKVAVCCDFRHKSGALCCNFCDTSGRRL